MALSAYVLASIPVDRGTSPDITLVLEGGYIQRWCNTRST